MIFNHKLQKNAGKQLHGRAV